MREDKVVTVYSRAIEYFNENTQIVYGALGALLFVIAALVGYNYLQSNKQEKAIVEMATAVVQFEQGNYQAALDGVDGNPGLLSIVDDYGSTGAGNLARFYAADSYFRLGQFDESLKYFSEYNIEADYIGASAIAGEAAIHELRGEFAKAGDLFMRASELFESDVTSPGYLIDAARAYVQAGAIDDALNAYDEIEQNYGDAPEAQQIDVLRAAAKVRAG